MFQYGTPIGPRFDQTPPLYDARNTVPTTDVIFETGLHNFLNLLSSSRYSQSLQRLAYLVNAEHMLISRQGRHENYTTISSFDHPESNHYLALKKSLVVSKRPEHPLLMIELDQIQTKKYQPLKQWLKGQNIHRILNINLADNSHKKANICLFFTYPIKQDSLYLNQYYIVSHLANELFGHLNDLSPRLTHRQIECLRWAALGKSEADTADILAIESSTVKFHLNGAFLRLGAPNKTAAVAIAVSQGLIEI